jgi:hypothetical protein
MLREPHNEVEILTGILWIIYHLPLSLDGTTEVPQGDAANSLHPFCLLCEGLGFV